MNLDLGAAFTRAQAVVNGLVAAIPGLIVALVVFGGFLLVAAIVKGAGAVEDIQTRATFIRTYDGRRVVVPNAELFTDTVVVNTAFEHRRLEYDVGIGPSPTQQILFHDQTEDSDGDRARQREGWPAGNTDVAASRKVADAIRHLSGSKPRRVEGE